MVVSLERMDISISGQNREEKIKGCIPKAKLGFPPQIPPG
jgi:hypothetical protein